MRADILCKSMIRRSVASFTSIHDLLDQRRLRPAFTMICSLFSIAENAPSHLLRQSNRYPDNALSPAAKTTFVLSSALQQSRWPFYHGILGLRLQLRSMELHCQSITSTKHIPRATNPGTAPRLTHTLLPTRMWVTLPPLSLQQIHRLSNISRVHRPANSRSDSSVCQSSAMLLTMCSWNLH